MWRCNRRRKESTTGRKSFLPLPLAAEQQLETGIDSASQPQAWEGPFHQLWSLGRPQAERGQQRPAGCEGQALLRASYRLGLRQLLQSPINNEAKLKKVGKILQLAVSLSAQGLSCS